MKLVVKMDRQDIANKIPFAVIVENWESKSFGKNKRKYYNEFNEKERRILASYYKTFYRWYLVTGIPSSSVLTFENIELIGRAGNFFADI